MKVSTLVTAIVAVLLSTVTATAQTRLLRQPTVSASHIAFAMPTTSGSSSVPAVRRAA